MLNKPQSPGREPGDSGWHPFPGAMRCGFEAGNRVQSCRMDGGVVFVPGVPGLPPGASWKHDSIDQMGSPDPTTGAPLGLPPRRAGHRPCQAGSGRVISTGTTQASYCSGVT